MALAGLHALDQPDAADALASACDCFPGGEITDGSFRRDVLRGLERDAFAAEDRAFYAAYPSVFRSAAAYIRAHPAEFFE